MQVTEFFNNDYVSYAAYDNIRKIANYVDGLKSASRKVLYTFLEDNINKDIKVNRSAAKVSEKCEYLHGESSLEGVIAGMAQSFVGANNLPLLSPEGSFGTRFIPKAGASRYIYTKLQPYTRLIFRKEDESLLEKQIFEGNVIEYKFYVPIIPMLLVNGSSGVSNGFAQKILPRKVSTIIQAIEDKLNDKDIDLTPGIEGYKGDIIKYENGWEIRGKFERIGRTKILITEIPPQYSLKKYISILDKLEDNKVIRRYKDLSENDNFKFEIDVSSEFVKKDDKYILEKLKLIQKEVENFSTIDENNRIKVFDNEYELFDAYFKIRYEFYKKRKNYQLKKLKSEIEYLKDKINFINAIIENKIIINKKSKEEIIKQAEKLNIKYIEEHLKMQLWNLTQEKIDELLNIIDGKEKEYEELLNKSEKQIWLEELNELKKLLNNT